MANCIYTNRICPFHPTRCLFYNNVSRFLDIKLVQYVLSQYNGEFRGQISIGANQQYINDYLEMYCGGLYENCEGFVVRCIREIWGINITGNILNADFTGSNINELKVMRTLNDLQLLQRGSLLFTLDTASNPIRIIPDTVTPSLLKDMVSGDAKFSHVFFHLGILQPSGQMYIGGSNHASTYMRWGVAKFNDMFNLANSVLTYRHPLNHGSRYLLLAATLS